MSENTSPKVTLLEFISENEPSLTVAGIFIAIAAFWLNLPVKPLASFVAFLSIVITIPIFVALFKKITDVNPSIGLLIFSNIFFLVLINVIWYVLVVFRPELKTELYKVFFWSLILPLFSLYKRYLHQKFHKKLMGYWERYDKWVETKYLTKALKNNKKEYFGLLKKLIKNRKHYSERINLKIEYIERQENLIVNTKRDRQEHLKLLENAYENEPDENEKIKYIDPIKATKNVIWFRFLIDKIANYLLLSVIFVVCAIILVFCSNALADFINKKFDSIYDSYQKDEQKNNQNKSPESKPSPTPELKNIPPQFPV